MTRAEASRGAVERGAQGPLPSEENLLGISKRILFKVLRDLSGEGHKTRRFRRITYPESCITK